VFLLISEKKKKRKNPSETILVFYKRVYTNTDSSPSILTSNSVPVEIANRAGRPLGSPFNQVQQVTQNFRQSDSKN